VSIELAICSFRVGRGDKWKERERDDTENCKFPLFERAKPCYYFPLVVEDIERAPLLFVSPQIAVQVTK